MFDRTCNEVKLSTLSIPALAPVPDFLESPGSVRSIAFVSSERGPCDAKATAPFNMKARLQIANHLNEAKFDLSTRINHIEMFLKDKVHPEKTPSRS
jgi:hypothetical protein